jgi:hypothetical protein
MVFGKKKQRDKENEIPEQQVVGGIPFFISLAVLLPTGALFFVLALFQVRHTSVASACVFLGSCIVGALLAQVLIRGHVSVLLHEFKHALISNLVGNKNKRMKIEENSGHLEYAYSKRTAHYNAFIALAPYIVPVCTFVGALLSAAVAWGNPTAALIGVGLGYGADLILNARDISPIQTDISLIRGGYHFGLLYILAWNLLTTAIILAWAFQGAAGVLELLMPISQTIFAIHFSITGTTPSGE